MENPDLATSLNSPPQATLLLAKIAAMIILGFGSLGLGMLPLIVGRCRLKRRQKCCTASSTKSTSNQTTSPIDKTAKGLLTSLLLCFGGGVLLFTTFLHLAPEVRQSVERHQSNGQLITLGTLSMAELLFCVGFFLVYFVEETVHAALTGKTETTGDLLYRTVSVRRCNKQSPASASTTTITTVATNKTPSSPTAWKIGRFRYENEDKGDGKIVSEVSNNREDPNNKRESVLPAVFLRSSPSLDIPLETGRGEDDRFVPRVKPKSHSHIHSHADTSVRGLLTVIALSFHAIFEGLAVGLEPNFASVVYLAGAIATHKLVIAFCVGMELYVTGASSRTILGYLSVFSMVTPLGIMTGIALGHFNNDSENFGATPTILQGMAAGTLLYVVFFEVLARERANDKSGLLQLLAIISGFLLMLGLQLLTAHTHAHSHSHGSGHGHSHETEEEHEEHDHRSQSHSHADHDHVNMITGTIDRISTTVVDAMTNAIVSTTTGPLIREKRE